MLSNIIENTILIEEFTRGMELISEAAKNLGELAEELCPTVPWADVRALGNFLRHEYDSVDAARVWLMIEDDLGPLIGATQRALERLRQAAE